jgi:nicotinamide-nucleotide amidase
MKALTAHIIAIGSELLHGGRSDGNSLFIADELAACGIEVKQKTALGDDAADIASILRRAVRQADVIVTTGGLGSTLDDCTREGIAEAFGLSLAVRKRALQMVLDRLSSRGRAMTPVMTRQARIPAGATVLVNPVGTAPGFFLRHGRAVIFVLPGVPREATEMMRSQVQPVLRRLQRTTGSYRIRWSHAFNTFGLSEIAVQELLVAHIQNHPSVRFGFLASTRGVKVTLSRWCLTTKAGKEFAEDWGGPGLENVKVVETVRMALGPWLFSEYDEPMEEVVGKALIARGWTLAVAESCTGGLVAHRLTEMPGSSVFLDRGIVSYSNRAKIALLGVQPSMLKRHGAVSLPVAQAMASGVRRRSGVDVGLSITGIAGPGGGSPVKPVGTVCMGIHGPQGVRTRQFQFLGDRSEIKLRSSQAALDLVRRYLQEEGR